jgi:hypothetical protein
VLKKLEGEWDALWRKGPRYKRTYELTPLALVGTTGSGELVALGLSLLWGEGRQWGWECRCSPN